MKWNIFISSVILVTKFLTCCAQIGSPWQRPSMFRPPLIPSRNLLRLNRNRFPRLRRFPFLPSLNMPFGDRNNFMNRPSANRFGPPQNAFTAGNANPAIPGPSTTGQANSNRVGNIRTMFPNSERNPSPNGFERFPAGSGSRTFSNFQRNSQVPSQSGVPSSNNFSGFQRRRSNQLNMNSPQFRGVIRNQQQAFPQSSQEFQQRLQRFSQQQQRFSQQATRQQQQQQQQQISRFPMNPFSRQTLGRGTPNIGRRPGQMPQQQQGISPIASINQWRSPAMLQNNFQRNRNVRPRFDPIQNQVLTPAVRQNIAQNQVIQSQTVPTTPIPVIHHHSHSNENLEKIFSSEQALQAFGKHNNQAESSGSDASLPPEGTQLLPENFDMSKLPEGSKVQSMVTIADEKGNILYRGFDLPLKQIDEIANEIAANMSSKLGALSASTTPEPVKKVTINSNREAVVENPSILGESQTFAGVGTKTDPLANIIADSNAPTTLTAQANELGNSPFFPALTVPSRPNNRPRGPLQFLGGNQNTGSAQSPNSNVGLFQSFLADAGMPGSPGAVP